MIHTKHLFIVQWVLRSIPYGRPIELFHIPASAPQMVVKKMALVCAILSLDGAYKTISGS